MRARITPTKSGVDGPVSPRAEVHLRAIANPTTTTRVGLSDAPHCHTTSTSHMWHQ